ncbi:MAG: Rpn family recombination-promoting nuclease/putative transposase [Clostridiales bacterium]|nr:Rpn family recombination-promoting nuclease/putative transposase [Clostridiales bacterium]
MVKNTFNIALLTGSQTPPAEILDHLKQYPVAYGLYLNFPTQYQKEFLDFCSGEGSIYLCYDAFFHFVFDTNRHLDRVEYLLSALLNQKVHIIEVLPREGTQMAEMGSEVIVDLLVRLEDRSLVNLEIQKYGYNFPAMRMDCYCADLIMREYNRLHNKYGNRFTYQKLHPVIAIVLLEKNPSEFSSLPDIYLHHGNTTWDSGLKLPSLTRQVYVCLDKFNNVMQNRDIETELEAWLTALTTRSLVRIDELIRKFPDFADIYREIFEFRTRPEELIHMYSEVLAAADRNMDRMMIDEMREEIEKLSREIVEKKQTLADKDAALADKDAALAEQQTRIDELTAKLAALMK